MDIPEKLKPIFFELLGHLKGGWPLREKTKEQLIDLLEKIPPRKPSKSNKERKIYWLTAGALEVFGNTAEAFDHVANLQGVNVGISSVRDYYYRQKGLFEAIRIKMKDLPTEDIKIPKDYDGPIVYVDGDPCHIITLNNVYYFDKESRSTKVLRTPTKADLCAINLCLSLTKGETE